MCALDAKAHSMLLNTNTILDRDGLRSIEATMTTSNTMWITK